jgi:hypothetical protein
MIAHLCRLLILFIIAAGKMLTCYIIECLKTRKTHPLSDFEIAQAPFKLAIHYWNKLNTMVSS